MKHRINFKKLLIAILIVAGTYCFGSGISWLAFNKPEILFWIIMAAIVIFCIYAIYKVIE